MKLISQLLVFFAIIFNTSLSNAALVNNGGGFIYDTISDITWYDYRFGGLPGQYDYPYGTTWNFAMEWASTLEVAGVTDWRLPLGVYSSNGEVDEVRHLFVDELNYGLTNDTGPFTSYLGGSRLWLGAESTWDKAWSYDLTGMNEETFYKNWTAYALAVHDGNVGPSTVPLPSAIWLMSSAFLGLVGLNLQKRRYIA